MVMCFYPQFYKRNDHDDDDDDDDGDDDDDYDGMVMVMVMVLSHQSLDSLSHCRCLSD